MIALLGCVPPPTTPSTSPFLAVAPDAQVAVAPSPDEQTHPALLRTAEGWRVAWDQDGAVQRADARALSPAGDPQDSVLTLRETGGAGFTTPDLALGDDGDWYVALRVDQDIEVARYRGAVEATRQVVGSGAFGFWTAPDLARLDGELVVGWWDGDLAVGAPAAYPVVELDWDLAPLADPAVLARSAGTGSPLAVEAHPDGGFVVAWSEQALDGSGSIHLAHADRTGAVVASARVDDVALPFAPTRPALAVGEDGGVVVGWRAQDDEQVGFGTRLRWFDSELAPRGRSVALGLAPASTNRVALGAAGDWLAAAWEESTADGDVVLQLFDRVDGTPLTGPMRVHDDVAGRQARPAVEVVDGADGLEVGVVFESGPVAGPSEIQFRRFR